MESIARYKNVLVKVDDRFEMGGVNYATVTALQGLPFVGGDTFPVRSRWATVRADALEPVETPAPEPKRRNLLAMALEQTRQQWQSGQVVYLAGNRRRGVFLKENRGIVNLHLSGYDRPLTVFILNPVQGWQVMPDLEKDYVLWTVAAQRHQEEAR